MTLAAGSQLGPFEIVAPLGAGGMGEVYRARDPRLERVVAIKVLPAEVAGDPERLKRFQREARSASALNHPNLVTVHETGTSGGVSWIAMEHVEGDTLRRLLVDGALPVKRLLRIATQVADGLAKAHEAGIVHRDLKPENVMVTRDGLVKILDFGLAKASAGVSGSDENSQLPTMTGTGPGVVLGTVGYMSPEQAAGKAIDFHSDQFSFGSILYEMATGKRAFAKKTAVDTLSAILNEEPQPMASANPLAPAPLRWIVERCLAKEPEDRYVSTRDLARELGSVQTHLSETASGDSARVEKPRRRRVPFAAAVGAGVLLLAMGFLGDRWIHSLGSGDVPSFRRLTYRRGNLLTARFAPDGRTVVYGAAWDGAPGEIFTARTDSIESRPLGFSRADVLAVSPKGELAILIRKVSPYHPGGTGTLARVPLGGGTPREVLDDVVHADWSPNGEDLAVVRALPSGRSQLQYPIGTVLAEGDSFESVRVSPRGDLVAFVDMNGGSIHTIDRKGKRTDLAARWHPTGLAWSPRGDEIYFTGGLSDRDEAIRAVTLSGRMRVLVPIRDFGIHDVAADGRLLLERGITGGGVLCRPRNASREIAIGWSDLLVPADIADDGSAVALYQFGESEENEGIYLSRTDGSPPVRLGGGHPLELSPDGRSVLSIHHGPPPTLFVMPTGLGAVKALPVEGIAPTKAHWLASGRGFLVTGIDPNKNPAVVVVGPEGGRSTRLQAEEFADHGLVMSPARDRVAYVTKDGRLRTAPLSGGTTTLVPGPPLDPNATLLRWSADDRFLYLLMPAEIPAHVDRLELSTGRRETWKTFSPPDSVGLIGVGDAAISMDGESYAYYYSRALTSDLYVAEGVK